jgi:hypothetical protein
MIISGWPDFKKEPPTNLVSLMTRRVTSSEQFQVTRTILLELKMSHGLSRPTLGNKKSKGRNERIRMNTSKTVRDPKFPS